MAYACSVVKTLLVSGWTKTNTDGVTPTIINSSDDNDSNNAKRIDISSRDVIKIYENAPETRQPNGIGAAYIWRESHITIDVMSAVSMLHAVKVRDEVLRVVEANYNSPGTGYQFTKPEIEMQNFSGVRDQRLWRWTIDIKLVKTNASLGG